MSDIKAIKARIDAGIKYWEKENKAKFERYRNFLKIQHYPKGSSDVDRISVPFVHSLTRTKMASIFMRNPRWAVTAKTKISPENMNLTLDNLDNAKAVMNYFPDEIRLEEECKAAVLDSCGFGAGFVKIGFEFAMEENNQPAGLANKVIEGGKKILGLDDKPKILVDRFYVKRVSYPMGDFIWDPESTNGLADAKWCAERISISLQEAKSNRYWKNTDKIQANGELDKKEINRDMPEEKRFLYWRYYEKNRYGVCATCVECVPDQDIELRRYNNPYDHGEFPYEDILNYIVPDYTFPVGDIQPVATQQQELDKIESLLLSHMKRFPQKYLAKRGSLKSKGREALEAPENTVVEVGEMSDIRALENPSVNQTVPLSSEIVKRDMTQVFGVSEYQQGVLPEKRSTLGEAEMVQSGSQNRSSASAHEVTKFMKRVGRKLFQTIQQYLTDEIAIKITGDTKTPDIWPTISRDNIQGEFDIDIEPYSMLPVNEDKLKRQALDLYNLMIMDKDLTPEARMILRKNVVEKFGVKEVEPFLQIAPPPPPPMAPEGTPPEGMPPEEQEPAELGPAVSMDKYNEQLPGTY